LAGVLEKVIACAPRGKEKESKKAEKMRKKPNHRRRSLGSIMGTKKLEVGKRNLSPLTLPAEEFSAQEPSGGADG